ncbi:MAG: hypothetical protein IKC03_07030 [Oscillospiraceae bacterium]|nr:hypothetical protein [Oscillospiraceae bacterium]
MGIFDSLFSSKKSSGGVPDYLKKSYKQFGLDPDDEGGQPVPNVGKKMYCTMCRKIYVNGAVRCRNCDNVLIELK